MQYPCAFWTVDEISLIHYVCIRWIIFDIIRDFMLVLLANPVVQLFGASWSHTSVSVFGLC